MELPDDVLTDEIRQTRLGVAGDITPTAPDKWSVTISYPEDNFGDEITQFLNVLFGNVSMFSGVKVTGINWDAFDSRLFQGPAFGTIGVRKSLGINTHRALSCTALKPMGSSTETLAEFAHQFALGGIDIIKDDHGLANQRFSPFNERLKSCVEAINRANDKTGHHSVYYPNITADGSTLLRRYEMAYESGAGGVLVSPHLTGLSALNELARLDIPLPVMAHPAFSGALTQDKSHGFSRPFLYGELWRALGADFCIYPNAGGRFSFTADECRDINHTCRTAGLPFNPAFPTPGGGVQRDTIPGLLDSYGKDTVFLIGGSLYQHPKGIEYAAREISTILEG